MMPSFPLVSWSRVLKYVWHTGSVDMTTIFLPDAACTTSPTRVMVVTSWLSQTYACTRAYGGVRLHMDAWVCGRMERYINIMMLKESTKSMQQTRIHRQHQHTSCNRQHSTNHIPHNTPLNHWCLFSYKTFDDYRGLA